MQKKAPEILKNAINRTATNAKTNISKEVSKKYNIKSGQVLSSMKISKATKKNLSAKIKSSGYAIPLIDFKVTPTRPVRYLGKKGKKRPSPKVYKSAVFRKGEMGALSGSPKPFVQRMKSGHLGVFERVLREKSDTVFLKNESGKRLGKKYSDLDENQRKKYRSKITEKYGPSIPQMIKNEELISGIEQKVNQMLEKRVQHEIDRVLGGS